MLRAVWVTRGSEDRGLCASAGAGLDGLGLLPGQARLRDMLALRLETTENSQASVGLEGLSALLAASMTQPGLEQERRHMSLRLPQPEGWTMWRPCLVILPARTQKEPFLGAPASLSPGPRGPAPQCVSGNRQLWGQHKGARMSSNTRLMS